MATLMLRTFAFLAIAFAAIVATCYALLVIWDRTHLPQLPPEMRTEVWNGGKHGSRSMPAGECEKCPAGSG